MGIGLRQYAMANQSFTRASCVGCGMCAHVCPRGPTDGVFVRVGSTNRRADRDMVEELRRYARGEAFDEQPMPGLGSEAVDFRAASELFAPVRKLARGDLETLRLVTSHQGRLVPTVGGMILFGRDREQHFPDAWNQVGRFEGTDKSRILDRAARNPFEPSKRRSPSCRNTPSMGPRSVRCAGESVGAYRLWPCARR